MISTSAGAILVQPGKANYYLSIQEKRTTIYPTAVGKRFLLA
jgi:hypothetical protein